jgi:hypothetical protein
MTVCARCGAVGAPEAVFCPNCGSRVGGVPLPRPRDVPEGITRPPPAPEAKEAAATPVGVGWRPEPRAAESGIGPVSMGHEDPAVTGRPKFSRAATVGFVRGLTQRPGPNGQVYTFRIEVHDSRGNRLPPVAVEMKGVSFEGILNEGDEVEIRARPRPGRVVRVHRLSNLTAGSVFAAKGIPLAWRVLVVPWQILTWIVVAAILAGVVTLLVGIVLALISDG